MSTTREQEEYSIADSGIKKRPSIFDHLPPLSAPQPSYSSKPKIVEYGAYTKASPTKEKQYYRHASDSVANNYSPSAQGLSTHIIYKRNKNSSVPPSRKNTNTKKKQEFVVKEDIKVLPKKSHSVPGTFSVLSEGATFKTPGVISAGMGFVTKGRFHHFSSNRIKGTKSELDTTETKEIGLDSSTLSHTKPSKLKRVQSAGQPESLLSSDVQDSGYQGYGESGSPHSKRTRIAWSSMQGAAISTNDDVIEDLETELKETEEVTNGAPSVCGRDYDEETLAVLNVKFPAASLTPTLGLPRAVTPPESQAKRFVTEVETYSIAVVDPGF